MKNRTQKTISVSAVIIGLSLFAASTLLQAETSRLQERYTPNQLQKSCDSAGGVYSGQTSSGSTYSCSNDNGNVICSGTTGSCVGTRYGNSNTGGTETGGAALTGAVSSNSFTLDNILRKF